MGGDTSASFGLGVPNGGDFADPNQLARLAADAEAAGWDGFFLWDHVIRRPPWQAMVDPWVTLAAIAASTERLTIGPMVTPLARRRVSVVARQTVTLDLLSHGRLRFGVGLGAPDDEFTRFGEDAEPRRRARILDESLDALVQLWSGGPVTFRGEHVTVDDVEFRPRPVRGHVPIWVAGGWPGSAPFRRAARFDGVWPVARAGGYLSVDEFADCVAAVRGHRSEIAVDGPFDACFIDRSPSPADVETLDKIARLGDVGMTWWIDSLDDPAVPFEQHRRRVLAGPPT
jgi:alkanesulfonate monooxygenase SsuD/methylene tetrahydromethanopterin reductase-like flavin-dependent oxidoreductase (luciferase family)